VRELYTNPPAGLEGQIPDVHYNTEQYEEFLKNNPQFGKGTPPGTHKSEKALEEKLEIALNRITFLEKFLSTHFPDFQSVPV